ncbi:hypothetical protein ABZW03_08325 [Kitasatospora sp. NPDC004799]|uniref:hypothetical protein n=1 Tax=Kitasatospora sp. NPDC004799 TaxID=3154460 RepID=UPI0033B89C15
MNAVPAPHDRAVPPPAEARPGYRPLPAGRAALFTGVATALGAAGHHLATDVPFEAGPMMLGAALLFAGTLAAARRRRSQPFWLAWTAGGQGLLHVLLTPPPAHHHPAPGGAGTGHHGGAAMLTAHLVAALLVGGLVHRADQAWWALPATLARAARRALRRVGRPLLVTVRPSRPRPLRPFTTLVHGAPGRLTVHTFLRRGPPATGHLPT